MALGRREITDNLFLLGDIMTFLEYFNRNVVPIKLIDKDNSWFMKLIAGLLAIGNFFHITNIRDNPHTEHDESFMGGYGTTIGHTIYDNPGWSWNTEPNTHVCHELCHAVQASFKMGVRYIISPRWRMFYESECVQCEVLCFPGPRGRSWYERRVSQFVKYGIPEWLVREELRKRLAEIDDAKFRASAAKVAKAYTLWKNEHGA